MVYIVYIYTVCVHMYIFKSICQSPFCLWDFMEHVNTLTPCASQAIAVSVRLRAAKGDELEAGVVPARSKSVTNCSFFRIIVALYRMIKQTNS